MRVDQVVFANIHYHAVSYPESLYRSLKRIGLNFPIQVSRNSDGYTCIDGHKRLSAIARILEEDPSIDRFKTIPVIVKDYARSEVPYHMHNHH